MEQAELFTAAHARRDDPATSRLAARSAWATAEAHKRLIHWTLVAAKEPITASEIAAATGLSMVQVCRRLPDLQRDKLAEPTEETRPSQSGRASRCWRVRPVGEG